MASRKYNDELEWTLSDRIFNDICRNFGIPDIDLFATRLNAKVPKYCSYMPDPNAYAVDSFKISWKHQLNYGFPPFILISRILKKVKQEKATMILVVPAWPTKPWYPLLKELKIAEPCVYHISDVSNDDLFVPSRPDMKHKMKKMILEVYKIMGRF